MIKEKRKLKQERKGLEDNTDVGKGYSYKSRLTSTPRNAPVLDERPQGEFLQGAVSRHQTVTHGPHNVNIPGP